MSRAQEADALRREFQGLSAQWHREAALRSSVTAIATHPAYQQIIGMGQPALPLIFRELRREPDHWFWALHAVTGENSVPDEHAGDLEAMTADWLTWGETHGCFQMPASDLEDCFPSLPLAGYGVTSPQTPRYNCIAWAAGDTRRWQWPDPSPFAYWPLNIPRENTLQRFIEAFQTLGYEPCENADLEPDVEKVAVYADDAGAPTHAARQLPTGAWTSKLGREEDIEHSDLAGVAGAEHGHVVQLLKRPRSGSAS